MSRPKAFIGSSTENLKIAQTLQINLERSVDVTVWSQGTFAPTQYTLAALESKISNSDFGIFVLGPDDRATMRDKNYLVTRDNVLFELGMFIGGLGKDRNFIVHARNINDFHLPTDLLGLTCLDFEQSQSTDLEAILGPVSTRIQNQIERIGLRVPFAFAGKVKDTALNVIKGNLLDFVGGRRTTLLPANRYFDTIMDKDVLHERSTLAKFLDQFDDIQRMDFDKNLDHELSLSGKFIDKRGSEAKKPGRTIPFKMGTIARVQSQRGEVMLGALSYLSKGNGSGYTAEISEKEFVSALHTMWSNIKKSPVRNDLYIPIVGAGICAIPIQTALAYILMSFQSVAGCSDKPLCESLNVVVYDKKWNDGKWVQRLFEGIIQ